MHAAHRLGGWFAAVAVLVTSPGTRAQQQTAKARTGWPCNARIDPSYFQIAEATGGQLLLLAPEEIAASADLLVALDRHPQTIFRLAGMMTPGAHDFRIPIDPSVESVLFSISAQCMQSAEVIRPSGAPAAGDGVTDRSSLVAERMVIVERPEPGAWTVRAGGSGLAGVMVKARSTLQIRSVDFSPGGDAAFTSMPRAGGENIIRIGMRGSAAHVEASLVNAASRTIAPLSLTPGDAAGTYVARFTPGTEGFRVMVTGQDPAGSPFQRVHAPLFPPR